MKLSFGLAFVVMGCGSSSARPEPEGGVSAGELTPPASLCEMALPLPANSAVDDFDVALEAAGVKLPPAGDDGFARSCQLDAFQCRAQTISIYRSGDASEHYVGVTTNDGARFLVKLDAPEDGTCGHDEPKHNTFFVEQAAVAERTFSDCQSTMDYRDWLVVDPTSGDPIVRLHCQGASSLTLDERGATIMCVGKRFEATLDALRGCYAG